MRALHLLLAQRHAQQLDALGVVDRKDSRGLGRRA